MKKIFFTPGPSQLYPTVKKHITNGLKENIFSISHRGEKFHEIFQGTTHALRKLLNIPHNYHIFFLSSGTEAMERIIENTVERHSFHLVNGAFSSRFYETAFELGKKPMKVEAQFGYGFDLGKAKVPTVTELICVTQNETSTGVSIPVEQINLLKNRYPGKLIAVDIVSGAPYADIDYSQVDLVFFSAQKGFGLPAGLAPLIVSPQAIEKFKYLKDKKSPVGSFHSFDNLLQYLKKKETPETPNVLGIYILGEVARDMLEIGMSKIRTQTEVKADLLYDFFGNEKGFKPFVAQISARSQTVIVIETSIDSQTIIDKLKTKGLYVGNGYGEYKSKQLRIANFPAHSVGDIKRLIKEVRTLSRNN